MREESHLDDMRSAIRGDFERLAERRGGQDLMREPTPGAEPEPVVEPEPEPVASPELLSGSELLSEPETVEPVGVSEGEPNGDLPDVPPAVPPGESPPKSFLDRLFGR